MKDLAYRPNVPVGSLPTPTTALAGVIVRLTTDNKAYWCDGTQWVDLTAAGDGGTAPRVYVQPTAPTVQANTPYIWIQTGLGPQGQDTAMWFEDGAFA